jgi:hypothetical protein
LRENNSAAPTLKKILGWPDPMNNACEVLTLPPAQQMEASPSPLSSRAAQLGCGKLSVEVSAFSLWKVRVMRRATRMRYGMEAAHGQRRGKKIYKQRAATSETVNADLRTPHFGHNLRWTVHHKENTLLSCPNALFSCPNALFSCPNEAELSHKRSDRAEGLGPQLPHSSQKKA